MSHFKESESYCKIIQNVYIGQFFSPLPVLGKLDFTKSLYIYHGEPEN